MKHPLQTALEKINYIPYNWDFNSSSCLAVMFDTTNLVDNLLDLITKIVVQYVTNIDEEQVKDFFVELISISKTDLNILDVSQFVFLLSQIMYFYGDGNLNQIAKAFEKCTVCTKNIKFSTIKFVE